MIIAFSGTRWGMQPRQCETVKALITALAGARPHRCELHHGDCVGADTQAHLIAVGVPQVFIVVHPASDVAESNRGHNKGNVSWSPDFALARNRSMVHACDVLVAAPFKACEEQRSGTWATIRYAREVKCPYLIVWPDGTVGT